MKYDVLIVGAGVIGGMLARELSRYRLKVCLLEKENDVAMGASKANSGIIHGGYDPVPGTLKAKLNGEGVSLLYQTAKELKVPHRNNGSLVCAFGKGEEGEIEKLYRRGIENGIWGLRILTGSEARALEPALSHEVTLALHVPTAGIICPYQLTLAAVGNAMDNGVDLKCNFEVKSIRKSGDGFSVFSEREEVEGRYLVNCAGAYSDAIASLAGEDDFHIIPRKGEYMLLDKTAGDTVSHTIFQVPSAAGKGVLVTPTADGNLLLGPTAVTVSHPEERDTTVDGLENVKKLSQKSIRDLDFSKVITSFCGVRASEGSGDFIIRSSQKVKGLVHLAAIDSPGLTACVSIARMGVDILKKEGLSLSRKENWDGKRTSPHFFSQMTNKEKNEFIRSHPEYGKIICRCETVTEGEIRFALRQNPPAQDMDGVKRRIRSGMGRCQGGFCSSYVMLLISEERGIPMEKVTKKGGASVMVKEKM